MKFEPIKRVITFKGEKSQPKMNRLKCDGGISSDGGGARSQTRTESVASVTSTTLKRLKKRKSNDDILSKRTSKVICFASLFSNATIVDCR